jgi:hypothetical protein
LEDLRRVWWNMVWVAVHFLENVDERRRGCYREDRVAVVGDCGMEPADSLVVEGTDSLVVEVPDSIVEEGIVVAAAVLDQEGDW